MSGLEDALGLYVHWPYCARICPYCDFNVYRPKGVEDRLFDAILTDMSHWHAATGGRPLASLHFGGGTPSLMSEDQVGRLIRHADALWGFAGTAEIGLEANPKEAPRYADFVSAGVNRLSVGLQSLHDDALEMLGRDHDGAQGLAALEAALVTGARVSADLIYARAGQTLDAWSAELGAVLGTGVGHLSPYQLTIEPDTAFGKRSERGEVLGCDGDIAADFYELTEDVCRDAGLSGYEISNHARTLADQSVHNRLYWEGGDWIGVGPGAHGRIGRHATGGRRATAAVDRPGDYIRAVEAGGGAVREDEVLTPGDEAAERILMGMRISDGLDRRVLRAATGLDVDADGLAETIEAGWLSAEADRVRLEASGRVLADRISGMLVPDVD